MITTRRDVFDIFYRQFDWEKEPFGCPLKQYTWLSGMIKNKISTLKGTCNGWILDDGGGYGIFYNFLKEEERENYVNLDLSIYLLKMSRGHRVRGVAEHLPFRDGSFDVVICSEVLEHVDDKIKTIREIGRVLKKNYPLILTTPRTGCREA